MGQRLLVCIVSNTISPVPAGYERLQRQVHMLKDSTFDTNLFSKSDVKEAAQEFNLISMDNNEDELGDIK